MPAEERRQLARALAAIDMPRPLLDPKLMRRRRVGLLIMMGCCIFLAGWIAVLMLKLPAQFKASHWRGVWVGLDLAELAGFAATAWASWRQRQVLIFCMVFTGTLLIGDAWFDLVLDYGTSGFTMSVLSAALAEIPLALLLFTGARRLVRATVEVVMTLEGIPGPVPPLWRVPLFADGLAETLPARFRKEGGGRVTDRRARVTLSQIPGVSRHDEHGQSRIRRAPAADVLDRVPDDRQRRGR
jgi:hypothetical protein